MLDDDFFPSLIYVMQSSLSNSIYPLPSPSSDSDFSVELLLSYLFTPITTLSFGVPPLIITHGIPPSQNGRYL